MTSPLGRVGGVWIAADEAERDAIGSSDGLQVNDTCRIQGVNDVFRCTSVDGANASTWNFGQWDNSKPGSPTGLSDGDFYYLDYDTEQGKTSFLYAWKLGESVPVCEWRYESYYHPGVIVDNINPDPIPADDVTSHACSFIWRLAGISQWQAAGNPNYDAQALDWQLRQYPEDILRILCHRRGPVEVGNYGPIGDTLPIDAHMNGNFESGGYIRARAINTTTGRAAFGWRAPSNYVVWFRQVAEDNDVEIASDRDGGNVFFKWREDGDTSGQAENPEEFLIVERQTVNDSANKDIVLGTLTSNGDFLSVDVVGTAMDDSGAANVYSRKISESVYRSGGTVTEMTRHIDDTQTVGTVVGWSINIVISGDDVILRLVGPAAGTVNFSCRATLKTRIT